MNEVDQLLMKARDAYDNGKMDDVVLILHEERLNDNTQALFLRGEACYKLQKWGDALNSFSIYLEKVPNDVKAKGYIEMIRNILGFHHKDFFNP